MSDFNFSELLKNLLKHSKNMHVLYVEDKESLRISTGQLLSEIFSSVTLAKNGEEGLEKFNNNLFDIIISDILMPIMDGLDMTRKIKEIDKSQHIIITSAYEDSDYLLKLINIGVTSFIPKPITFEKLATVLYEIVDNIYNAKLVHAMTIETEKKLIHQSVLLEQYREIVDLSTIVSKTDIDGNITYVNDAFCKISGYTKEQLIGKKHNIVKHPDVPTTVYEKLWKTILEKKVWRGSIKNKKKGGEYYITDATIKAILDEHGNIEEFISIRHDVTELFNLNEEIWRTQHEMLYLLGEVGETRSQEVGNHVRRVAEYSKLLAQLYGLNEEEITHLYTASPIHDIGKIGISDAILLKPGKLNDEEYEIMKGHVNIGFHMLKNSERPMLKAAAIIAYEHHEKWDGTGYPRGLSKNDIHIYGRITALADVFDALNCERVYKKSWPMDQIIELIRSERGKHFDPTLVDIFFDNLEMFTKISKELYNE